jgi:hypothetical protein
MKTETTIAIEVWLNDFKDKFLMNNRGLIYFVSGWKIEDVEVGYFFNKHFKTCLTEIEVTYSRDKIVVLTEYTSFHKRLVEDNYQHFQDDRNRFLRTQSEFKNFGIEIPDVYDENMKNLK